MFKKLLIVICFCFFAESVFAEPEEQLGPYARTWRSDGIRYGMPGLANIKVKKFYEGVYPVGDGRLVIDLEHPVQYGGSTYKQLTVASKGRIFLGEYKEGTVLPDDGDDGVYPYVKAISNEFTPVAGNAVVPVSWRKFNEHNDIFTVVEIGPFAIVGLADPMVCQVSFYDDGEIQVQYWNKTREGIAAKKVPSNITTFTERPLMLLPFVYNGNNRITLRDRSEVTVFGTSPINIYEKNVENPSMLREGWIAKSFVDEGPVFNEDYSGGGSKPILDVDFGSVRSSGGLLAYDYARENPIVGSFQYIQLKVSSEERGDDFVCGSNCQNGDIPVYFWYFNEKQMFGNNAHLAGYPYLATESNFYLDYESVSYGVNNACLETSGSVTKIYSCAYGYSWDKHPGIVDTVIAPAIKMQTNDYAYNRKIHIKSIQVRPLQPRSIQFKPPVSKKIEYEGKGGYLEVGGTKAPVSMIADASVHAIVHVTPGFKISQIAVNGKVAFDETDMSVKQPSFKVDNMPDQNMAYLDFKLVNDVKITVAYRPCAEKEVVKYDPSLANIVPSYKKIENFGDPADRTNILESYSVKDGFDQVVQTQIAVKPGRYLVSAVYQDEMGSTLYAPKPYIVDKSSYSFEPMYCQQCVKNSAAYYNGQTAVSKERIESYGFPYTQQNHHYGENKAIVGTSAGPGEASFELSDRFAKTWKVPVKTDKSSEFFSIDQMRKDKDPNAIGSVFDNEYINKIGKIDESKLSETGEGDYPYELTVQLSYDGVYTQEITDVAGNVMATWSMAGDEVLVTRNEYYGYGNDGNVDKTSLLKRSYIENHESFATTYEYDALGRLIAKTSPDRGRVETKYDSKSRIRFTRDQKQINKGKDHFNVLVYDNDDRVVMQGNVRGNCGGCSFDKPDADLSSTFIYPVHETIYGVPDAQNLHNKAPDVDETLLNNIVNSMEGVSIRDVSVSISYNDNKKVNTFKLSSYDRLGRVTKSWIVYNVESDAPAIEFSYTYRSSGEVDVSTVSQWNAENGCWDVVAKRKREYDSQGRLEKVYELDVNDNDKPMLLASYEYNSNGVEVKATYYDKGSSNNLGRNVVYSKEAERDIYGRILNVVYKDANGIVLYEEKLNYDYPLINRVSKATHTWNDNTSKKTVEEDLYTYDEIGRLSNFVTSGSIDKSGSYTYDKFGRLTQKTEGDSTLAYLYQEGSYQPVSVSLNGFVVNRALQYDAVGNVWLDGFNKVGYKLNSLGMPEHVVRFASLPATLSLNDVESGTVLDEEFGSIQMAYDESGTRIWERESKRYLKATSRVTVPGFGVYMRETSPYFAMERLDLVNGGYRNGGVNGIALFPMTDAQGNVRGYADKDGAKTLYTYYPFGQVTELENDAVADQRRWQDKEYDGEHGKYYFGARYFDSFLGLWMSPDPAYQYANPYFYGNDPINYVDPSGMISFDTGLFGWNKGTGWYIGIGAGPFSYKWHQDGSTTFSATFGGSWQWYIFNFEAGISYSYNSYTGHALTTNGSACIGVKKGDISACAGIEAGGGLYWDTYGNFLGATAYAGAFAEVKAGEDASLRVHAGYEAGLLGMEGRGTYAGVSGSFGGSSLYAEWSENGGWSYGFGYSKKFEKAREEANVGLLGFESDGNGRMVLELPEEQQVTGDLDLRKDAKFLEETPGTLSILGHGSPDKIEVKGKQMSADEFIAELKKGRFGYKNQKVIKFYSCDLAGNNDWKPNFATIVADRMNVTVIAATTKVIVDADAKTITLGVHALDAKKQPIYIDRKPLMVEGIGVWVKCVPGAGCLPYQDAYGQPY